MHDDRTQDASTPDANTQDPRTLALTGTDRRRLVRAAARLLGPAEAEDAVQDAFMRALEVDPQAVAAAPAWLHTVVRNLAIDQLRRRRWMDQWLAEMRLADLPASSPSAEADAALADEAMHALRLLAATLTAADGAAVLLYEVFEAGHAEIARAGGKSEAASRQQLRRALLRLRQAGDASRSRPPAEPDPGEDARFQLYLHALRLRDPQALWAMLRQPAVRAVTGMSAAAAGEAARMPQATACSVMQAGGQLGLVLTLEGVTLCVLPLGVRAELDVEAFAL